MITVDPANTQELSNITREIGAEVLVGDLRYPSETGGWQLGDLDLSEYLDRYRDQRPVLIIAPVGQNTAPTYTCGICGFVMDEPRTYTCYQLAAVGDQGVGSPGRRTDRETQVIEYA